MFRRFRDLEPGEFICVGVDTSAGAGDYSAAQFVSKTHLDVPIVLHTPQSITAVTPKLHLELERIHTETNTQPVIAYERQNGGLFEMERLGTLNRDGKYNLFTMPTYGNQKNTKPNKIGWDTNTATRPKMLQDLKQAIDTMTLTLYDKITVKELFTFIIKDTGKPEAEDNAHDDLVMSLAIAWQLYQTQEDIKPIPQYKLPQYQEPHDYDLSF